MQTGVLCLKKIFEMIQMVSGDFANEWFRQRVISPTSDFTNVTFANVLGRFAKAKSRFANVLLVTSPMY